MKKAINVFAGKLTEAARSFRSSGGSAVEFMGSSCFDSRAQVFQYAPGRYPKS